MCHEASHAGCAVVELTRTMRVQNYAGRGIKRDSNAESAPQTDTQCVRISSTSEMIQSVARVSRR